MVRRAIQGCRGHWWCGLVGAMALSVSAGVARAETRVVVVALTFQGEFSAAVRTSMEKKLGDGLVAAGFRLAPEADVRRALGERKGDCAAAACWKSVAEKLGCRYAVGGSVRSRGVEGDSLDYDIELWIGDARTGAQAARVRERCDICGLAAAAEKMELTASALAAKLATAERAPARVTVVTDPPGAALLVDGAEVGVAPREIELGAGEHQIVVRSAGYLTVTRRLTAVANVQERVEVKLVPLASGKSPARVAGWISISAGVAALAAGIALFAINGKAADCPAGVRAPDCRRDTLAEGGVLVGVGAAALGVGGYLLYRGYRRTPGTVEGQRLTAALSRLRFSF